jgi:hypothetical protein
MAEIFCSQESQLRYNDPRAVRHDGLRAGVKAGLGIAVIDQFTVAHAGFPGIELLRIVEPTKFDTYLAETRRAAVSLHRTFYPLLAFGNAGRWARSNWATEGCLVGLQKIVCYATGTSAQFRSRIVYLDTSVRHSLTHPAVAEGSDIEVRDYTGLMVASFDLVEQLRHSLPSSPAARRR